MAEFCLDCLQKQKPWVTNDMAILYSQPSQCCECGQTKKLVYVYTDNDNKLLRKSIVGSIVGGIEFNSQWNIHFTFNPPSSFGVELNLDEVEITLRTLVINVGWDEVRDHYMYLEGHEDGNPIAFKTNEEYTQYLNYKVINLRNKIILRSPNE